MLPGAVLSLPLSLPLSLSLALSLSLSLSLSLALSNALDPQDQDSPALSDSRGHNPALTVLCVPCSQDEDWLSSADVAAIRAVRFRNP